jgi:ankyrin repeat protein
LEEIDGPNWKFARRLLHCVAVTSRPLRVEELAEFLAFDFDAGRIAKYRKDWRLEDPIDAVLSTCSTLLSLVNAQESQVIQFSHFSVKEFLTSSRFSEKRNTISDRYHISLTCAQTFVAKACLGLLLHLDKDITRDTLPQFPLAEYAAEHWFEHARFGDVSKSAEEEMLQMFDRGRPHLAIWVWIWHRQKSESPPLTTDQRPLYYAADCDLYDMVEVLATENPQDVNSRGFDFDETPLHVASENGHVDVVRLLIEHGADIAAQGRDRNTPLHEASINGHVDVARLLIEHGADIAARSVLESSPLHEASEGGHVGVVRLLIEHGAGAAAQGWLGRTPLHLASNCGHVDVARLLIEHGAYPVAQNKHGTTPLHEASKNGYVDVARLLIEHSADPAAQDKYGATPLHEASKSGHVDVARLLIEHSADAAAQNTYGATPLHEASTNGHIDVVRFLIEHGANTAAQRNDGKTPLDLAREWHQMDVARFLIAHRAHSADAAAPIPQI